MNIATMSQAERNMCWTMGALAELMKLGLCDVPFVMEPLGTAIWDQIDADSLRPANIELLNTLCGMAEHVPESLSGEACEILETGGMILLLLIDFRDCREKLLEFCRSQRTLSGDD